MFQTPPRVTQIPQTIGAQRVQRIFRRNPDATHRMKGGDNLTTGDVARATGISQGTVIAHLRRGILRGEQQAPGRRWYIDPDDCLYWAQWCEARGVYCMYPLSRIYGYLNQFHSYCNRKH